MGEEEYELGPLAQHLGQACSSLSATSRAPREVQRLRPAASLLSILGLAFAVSVCLLIRRNHQECVLNGEGASCTFSPLRLWRRMEDVFVCRTGTVACAGLCLPGAADAVCCEGPSGAGILCAAGDSCCSGTCAAAGTDCSDVCAPGMVKCGGVCIAGESDGTCCIGPEGTGIMCMPGAECCDGVCLSKGLGCAEECAPGSIKCGTQCLVGEPGSSCCLGPSGAGIVCEADAECCDGVCLGKGQACAEVCAEGMIKCAGECMVGEPDARCCVGPSGAGIVCEGTAECCQGVCLAQGQGCADQCGEGLIECGGQCIVGGHDSKCCLGPSGAGIACEGTAECCHGVCVSQGFGCAEQCGPGLLKCAGQCVFGEPDAKCCEIPSGGGIVCENDAECCNGVCVRKGEGCAEECHFGLVKCGNQCVPAGSGKCCVGSSGDGIVCNADDECCDGVCILKGEGCAAECRPGTIKCGGYCMAAGPNATCCEGPEGHGIVCAAGAECCSGVCMAAGYGCAEECAPGLIRCGGLCMAGTPEDKCCEGPGGHGIVCEGTSECCDGFCVDSGEGCSKECDPGTVSCGGECMAGSPDDKCCLNPTGRAAIVCEPDAECCDGVCLAAGLGCAEHCREGTVKCGSQCLVGTASGTCCIGPSGNGIMCSEGAECCGGICTMSGQGCADPCGADLVACGGHCLPGSGESTCCTGPLGDGVLCGPDAECCNGACLAAGEGCAEECRDGLVKCGNSCLPTTGDDKCCVGPLGDGLMCPPNNFCCEGVCLQEGDPCHRPAEKSNESSGSVSKTSSPKPSVPFLPYETADKASLKVQNTTGNFLAVARQATDDEKLDPHTEEASNSSDDIVE